MKMTGGDALAGQLVQEGVRDVFGIPGVQLDWVVEGLRKRADTIRYVVPRHEQATTYMADGYARTTGRVGVVMVVPGPGVLNAMAGLSTAYACNSRVLLIAGSIHSKGHGRNLGLLHEIRNQTQVLAAATKWQARIETPEAIVPVVREAFSRLATGRPQPVSIEVAHDLLSATVDAEFLPVPAGEREAARLAADPSLIEQAAALLADAKMPVLYAGGGVIASGAGDVLAALAEKMRAPIVLNDNAKGAVSDRHALVLNTLSARAVMPHADVILVVGSRFVEAMLPFASWPPEKARCIHINLDPADFAPPRQPALALQADARRALEQLLAEVSAAAPGVRSNLIEDLQRVRAWGKEQSDRIEPQSTWVRTLRAALPDDAIVVSEMTQVAYFARLLMPFYAPGQYVTPGYQGTLGFGFATALGAAIGNPGRVVLSLNGDGGFGWNMQELATARRYHLHVITIVFNDGHFGNVRTIQKDTFGQNIGVALHNPDFGKLAAAFDIPFASVEGPEAITAVIHQAIARGGPTLIEAKVGEMPSPWHLFRLVAGPRRPDKAPPNPLGEVPA